MGQRLESAALQVAVSLVCLAGVTAHAQQTAWKDGRFHIDVASLVGRSDVVLAHPNFDNAQAVPLGNGTLGAAVWSADGMTVQLNREDTMPGRLSSGRLSIPGLASLTKASDYAGRLDLYHGEFAEHGAGISATAYIESGKDALVVDVTGADPNQTQTALFKLWSPRKPSATVKGPLGALAESWIDDKNPGATGKPFGTLAVLTADAHDVQASVTDPLTITVSFQPYPDGHFRIRIAAPHYDGSVDAFSAAAPHLVSQPTSTHRIYWQDFWNRAALIKVTSADGSGEYMENIRNLYLYVAACERGDAWPGSQAGVADMISPAQDAHRWDPSAFWHWNLRMQIAANISAGLPDLNLPYFNLYREDLPTILAWTKDHMKGLPGVCVPETMRFNGPGIEYENAWTPISEGRDCDAGFHPYYNARTLTTGAEVGLWVWQQYLATGDRAFLEKNYRLMAEAARFLLAYQKPGSDGLLHTSPSNSHETQWDVTDPTTDIAAIRAFFPAVIDAAHLLGRDADLAVQLQSALAKTPQLPRTGFDKPHTVLTADADAAGNDVIAESYEPNAPDHNVENIGLEPLWPYNLIGDTSPDFALARRTYEHRPSPITADWSFDPIQAARLHLGSEVGSTLLKLTERYQRFANGMAKWEEADREFYIEQSGIVAATLPEALVQDYDGLIRVAPALPPGWDFDGSVAGRNRTRVDVQTRNGTPATVVIESGSAQKIRLRNPWPSQQVDVIGGKSGRRVVSAQSSDEIDFDARSGESYLIERHDAPITQQPFAAVSGVPASSAKRLGPVQIGIF